MSTKLAFDTRGRATLLELDATEQAAEDARRAAWPAEAAAREAARQAHAAALADTPDTVQSVPELRDEFNALKAALRAGGVLQ